MARYLITGEEGFIGGALFEHLIRNENEVTPFGEQEDNHYDYLLHFGSPSSNILFNNPHRIEETITGFIRVIEYCRDTQTKLIYPSSSTVYDGGNPYAYTKQAVEAIVKAYNIDSVGFRIFAGYGWGEEHKRSYASPVYQFIKTMKQGKSPVIWGDGSQSRDFVWIEDIVNTIVDNQDETGLIDIGTGVDTSFNDVIKIINETLNTDIQPKYIPQPKNYIKQTRSSNPIKSFVPIKEGIRLICSKY